MECKWSRTKNLGVMGSCGDVEETCGKSVLLFRSRRHVEALQSAKVLAFTSCGCVTASAAAAPAESPVYYVFLTSARSAREHAHFAVSRPQSLLLE